MAQQASFTMVGDWWEHTLTLIPKEQKRMFNRLAIYTTKPGGASKKSRTIGFSIISTPHLFK